MNRIIISSLTFFLVIFFCFWGINRIEQITIPIVNQIEIAILYSENDDIVTSQEIIEFTYERWEKSSTFLGALLKLNDLDAIDDIFIRANEYAKNGDSSSFQIESVELIHRLEHLYKKEKLTLKNIF